MVIVFESTTYPGTTREMLLMQFAGNAQGWQIANRLISNAQIGPGSGCKSLGSVTV
jgi:hypothetical protein